MISEFVISPNIFDEIVQSFDNEKSLLLVAFTKVLEKSRIRNNNVVVANFGELRITKSISSSIQGIENQFAQLDNEIEQLSATKPEETDRIKIADSLKNKHIFLDVVKDRLNELLTCLEVTESKSLMFDYPTFIANSSEEDFLKIVNTTFQKETSVTDAFPFCLITASNTNKNNCKVYFKHLINWEPKQLLGALLDLNSIVYDSRKNKNDDKNKKGANESEKGYDKALKRLLRLSDTIAIVQPFTIRYTKDYKKEQMLELHEEFKMVLDIIEKKREKYNKYPHNNLKKIVVISEFNLDKSYEYDDKLKEQKRTQQQKFIAKMLEDQFQTPCSVYVNPIVDAHKNSTKIVDRRLYFGKCGSLGTPIFRWGVSVSHFFSDNIWGGVVSLISNEDVDNFQNFVDEKIFSQ